MTVNNHILAHHQIQCYYYFFTIFVDFAIIIDENEHIDIALQNISLWSTMRRLLSSCVKYYEFLTISPRISL